MKSLKLTLLLMLLASAGCLAASRGELERQLEQKQKELSYEINKSYARYARNNNIVMALNRAFADYFESVPAHDGNPHFEIIKPKQGTPVYERLKEARKEYEELSVEYDKFALTDTEYAELISSDLSNEEFQQKTRPALTRLMRDRTFEKLINSRAEAMRDAYSASLEIIADDYRNRGEMMPVDWIPEEQLKEAKRSIHVKEMNRQIKEVERELKKAKKAK